MRPSTYGTQCHMPPCFTITLWLRCIQELGDQHALSDSSYIEQDITAPKISRPPNITAPKISLPSKYHCVGINLWLRWSLKMGGQDALSHISRSICNPASGSNYDFDEVSKWVASIYLYMYVKTSRWSYLSIYHICTWTRQITIWL